MRDYQRQKGKYILPRAVYNQALWLIRDYDRLKEEAQAILDESPAPSDGQPRGNGTTSPTEQKAMKRLEYTRKALVIEKALTSIPREYRRGVWNNIVRYDRYPADASRGTYSRWKSAFVYRVAEEFKLF